ncbi:hypothetical protein K491DRAFT_714526 [Lophiostoma macrostomum CBS 122681]|uniref:Uncharacterized protein n=1 Tax=Lophiostoma macrostomum CBS 122681 TaxID=1314788 RepID=A0A6A6TD97_9PLEO|nr:hypothetical protein K491DRAFT_714526 [Lophiostoma macrostomum CBS 122681]
MAMNWERLQKSQRDYPKPKFAEKEITRQLKKRPTDPYLLAWKADNCLRADKAFESRGILHELLERQLPITDIDLLNYIYHIYLDAERRIKPTLENRPSAGGIVQKTWQHTAKSLPNRKARLDLWSSFFVSAMREECWDDVRVALIQARQDGYKSNKRVVFAQIFANQMLYETYVEMSRREKRDMNFVEKLPRELAFKPLQTAFSGQTGNLGDPGHVQDMRDLKLMADIFSRQDRLSELHRLWFSADIPQNMIELCSKYRRDMYMLYLSLRRVSASVDWSGLRYICLDEVSQALASPEPARSLAELSTRSWHVWKDLIEATEKVLSTNELPEQIIMEPIRDIIDRAFDSGVEWTGRSSRLTHLSLTAFVKGQLLLLCKKYWLENRQHSSCYRDLRAFVERLDLEERAHFQSHITESARADVPQSELAEGVTIRNWLHVETNVLKFHYLLIICLPDEPNYVAIPQLLHSIVRLFKIATQVEHEACFDLASLAVMTLLKFHRTSRFALQTAMLALHLTSDESGKQNRPLLLLSTRLHMMTGLTAVAVDQYRHVRAKEMLNDTLSHNLLTRISHVHPFDSKAMKIHPDGELRNVISTIDRMETKVDDLLYTDMLNFQYDQAFELLDLKRQLKSSLTKHLCIVERRRIARLKGEMVDDTWPCHATFKNISDNRDFDAWPQFNSTKTPSIHLFGTVAPTPAWVADFYIEREPLYWYLNEERADEGTLTGHILNHELSRDGGEPLVLAPSEVVVRNLWEAMNNVSQPLFQKQHQELGSRLDSLFAELCTAHSELVIMDNPDHRDLPYEDQPLPSTENQMQVLYGHLEVLQLAWKLCDQLDRKRKTAPLKTIVKEKTVKDLRDITSNCYKCIQEYTQKCIEHWKKHGLAIIKAQVRYGDTGTALKNLVADDELHAIARLYADLVIDTLSGVLQVKLYKK